MIVCGKLTTGDSLSNLSHSRLSTAQHPFVSLQIFYFVVVQKRAFYLIKKKH